MATPERILAEDAVKISNLSQKEWENFVLEKGWLNNLNFQKMLIESYNQNLSPVAANQDINLLEHYLSTINFGEAIRKDIENSRERMLRRESESVDLIHQSQNYGLIVGRIQSGKTGHMLGLAFACLSNPKTMKSRRLRKRFKRPASIVILLSSLIDDIRKQTLDRLTNHVTDKMSEQLFIGPERKADLTGDLVTQQKIAEYLGNQNNQKKQMLLVIKKNHHVLNRLKDIFNNISNPLNRQLSDVIIIDDECDYGSLDGNHADQNLSKTETTTNREVRELINSVRSRFGCLCWYIGYTATPFSNLLDNPLGHSQDGLHTLFPRGFIYSISEVDPHLDNSYYFGDQRGRTHIFFHNGDDIIPFSEELL